MRGAHAHARHVDARRGGCEARMHVQMRGVYADADARCACGCEARRMRGAYAESEGEGCKGEG